MTTTTSTKSFIQSNDDIAAISSPLTRQHQLDWLRVFALSLLIVYHTAMVFVANWGFHFKSEHQSETLQYFMLIVEPWRMASLWFISGVALQTAFSKYTISQLLAKRSFQLLLPLLVGVLIIVPPQLYVEMTTKSGLDISFFAFMHEFFKPDSDIFSEYQAGIWPHIDVNHLWYLRSLWQYSLVIILLSPVLNNVWLVNHLTRLVAQNPLFLAIVCYIPLVALQFLLDGEDKRYVSGFLFLLYGFFAARLPMLWQSLADNLVKIASFALVNLLVMLCCYHLTFHANSTTDDAWLIALRLSYSLAKLLGLLTMLAFASRFFAHRSATISTLNEAVYPCYLLHQTFIVVFAWLLSNYALHVSVHFLLIVLFTTLACALSIFLIKRHNVLRLCFGMPVKSPVSPVYTWTFYPLAVLGCIIIGAEILF